MRSQGRIVVVGALAASFGRFEVAMEVVGLPELAEAFAVQAERLARAGRGSFAEGGGRGKLRE